jgi:hypothetical protein
VSSLRYALANINVNHQHSGQSTTQAISCQDHNYQHVMPCQQDAQSSEQEGKITLALRAFQLHQFKSFQGAARASNGLHKTLSVSHRGSLFIDNRRNVQHKLTHTKEKTIIQYILDLDSRGFAPQLCKVADMDDVSLAPLFTQYAMNTVLMYTSITRLLSVLV